MKEAKMVRCRLVASVVVVLWFVANAGAEVTAIRAGKVVDPATGEVSNNQVILVDGQNYDRGGQFSLQPDKPELATRSISLLIRAMR